jgi:hypothetical protein
MTTAKSARIWKAISLRACPFLYDTTVPEQTHVNDSRQIRTQMQTDVELVGQLGEGAVGCQEVSHGLLGRVPTYERVNTACTVVRLNLNPPVLRESVE